MIHDWDYKLLIVMFVTGCLTWVTLLVRLASWILLGW
jgi:hypothetical protein